MLADRIEALRNPAAAVEDRSSTIRIESLRATWVYSCVFVKIETNHGVTGWGDIKGVDPRVSKPLVESLFTLLDGENPTRIEHPWQKVYRAHRDIRGGPVMAHPLAAIDMAPWDIAGKLWGVPVYRLLGVPPRARIRLYHTSRPARCRTPPSSSTAAPRPTSRRSS